MKFWDAVRRVFNLDLDVEVEAELRAREWERRGQSTITQKRNVSK